MDDTNFDKNSADIWAQAIESKKVSLRDKDFYPKISNWMDQFSPRKILDIGSGQGICSAKINLTNREYIGIDPSPFLIKRAQELYPSFKEQFIIGNAYDLPFPDHTFDASFSIAVWHLLENIDQASFELSRVLRKDGRFLIITAHPECYKEWSEGYDEVKRHGDKILGMDLIQNELKIQDTLFLHSYKKIGSSFSKAKLKITHSEKIRLWTSISGVKE